jgi:hypothetical protein
MKENIYATLPKSLTTQEVLVRSRTEDPSVSRERQALTQSKSVSELAQISSFADLPIPANIERLLGGGRSKTKERLVLSEYNSHSLQRGFNFRRETSPVNEDEAPQNLKESLFASLPRSMKAEVLVRSRMEDPKVLKERQELAKGKSVSELSRVTGLSDVPIPTALENIIQGKWKKADETECRSEK